MTNSDASDTDTPRRWIFAGIAVVALLGGIGFTFYQVQSNQAIADGQTVVDDLCLAAEQAGTDTDAALTSFNASPHNALHALDTDLRRTDPLAAQRLATAKADAENALIAEDPTAAELTEILAEQTADAYRILDDNAAVEGCD